jgi:hypothetical protein
MRQFEAETVAIKRDGRIEVGDDQVGLEQSADRGH